MLSPDMQDEIAFQLEQVKSLAITEKCQNVAPYIFYQEATGMAHVVQGCCNDWTCPRCGGLRAKHEYARIVNGAKVMQQEARSLYFWTLTCRGKDMPLETAEKEYMKWTNRLLTSARTKATRAGEFWCYAQVTERQRRQHPHSHLISTYCPPDAVSVCRGERLPNGRTAKHDTLWSEWFIAANARAGLGIECDLSLIRTPEAVAVYVAKYLFKTAMTTKWPKGWKRIRYSHSWPKLPVQENITAFPLIKLNDWRRMEALNLTVHADSEETYYASLARLCLCVVPPKVDKRTAVRL